MCQVNMIKEMGVDDTSLRIKKNFNILLRISGLFLFIQELRKFKTKKFFSENKDSQDSSLHSARDLKLGDLVRVRTKEQILKTLDSNNKLDGCFFMDEMWQYCKSQHKVLKNVNYFFDERGAKMYKAHGIVLLDGVHCSGKQGNLMPRCDRNCYIFWKEDWLEKIE